MRSRTSQSKAFTLIELLVVICLIAILLSMLLPAVAQVRNISMGVRCQANVRSLMGGFLAFSADHDGCLPGADRTSNPAPYQLDWLMSSYANCPQSGTVYPYINSPKIYLCPSMDSQRDSGAAITSFASNGKFDYGFFTLFNGCPIRCIAPRSQMNLLSGGQGWYPTPIICQEDGYQINGGNQEGNHSNVDQMSHIHNGGSWYATIDGSINFVIEPDVQNYWGDGCWQWTCMGPHSKTMVNLGNGYGAWGSWLQF